MGRLKPPHQTPSWASPASTVYLSCGERPVWTPVRTTNGPPSERVPSRPRTASSTSSGTDRFTRRSRPSIVRGGGARLDVAVIGRLHRAGARPRRERRTGRAWDIAAGDVGVGFHGPNQVVDGGDREPIV